MNTSWGGWFALFSIVAFFGGSSVAKAVTLVHSNDVSGELEPCGCRTNPQGGMARKYHLLKGIKDPGGIVQVDSGDLLFPSQIVPELLHKQSKVQARFLLQSMDLVHHDLAVPGEKDFALGFKVFEELRKGTRVQFIAANLTRKNGSKFLERHVILERKDADGKPVKVGIFAVVGEKLPWPKELKASSALEAAKKEVAALRGKVDYLIAVTHQDLEQDEKLAKAVSGIDVLVGGHTQSFLQDPHLIGKTYILESSFRNQYVGVLPLQKKIDIKSYRLEGLDAGYDSPAQSPSEMDRLIVDFKTAVQSVNTELDSNLKDEQANEAGSAKRFHTLPKCAQCHLVQFDFWRKTRHARALEPLLEKQQARNKECLGCHTVGLGDPVGYSNVNALAETRQAALDEETGPRVQTLSTEELAFVLRGFHDASSLDSKVKLREKDTEKLTLKNAVAALDHSWAPVQCENCHQPGRDHPFSGRYTKTVAKDACLKCHTFARAPDWYQSTGEPKWDLIAAKRKMITCPAGDITVVNE